MVSNEPLRVTVTGASGSVAYAFLFRLIDGHVFGADQRLAVTLCDVEPAIRSVEGVALELEDCSSDLLSSVEITSVTQRAFDGSSWAFLLGSARREAGMSRGDLLKLNAPIFIEQGKAINENAADDVRVIVVGNPCNSNAYVARTCAPDVGDRRWFAMLALDRNRARSYLAAEAGVSTDSVTRLAVWGNHSSTQVPDAQNAMISGVPLSERLGRDWARGAFLSKVRDRGSEIIRVRGLSSAGSAAQALADNVRELTSNTIAGDCFAAAVSSRGEYGVPEGLQFGFPVASDGASVRVVEGFTVLDDLRAEILASIREMEDERRAVDLLLAALQ